MYKDNLLKPYRGDQPYVFLSYAHKNMEEAMEIAGRLQSEGYNVWYDEGIDAGTEWDENTAEHLDQRNYFVTLIVHRTKS